MKELKEKGKDKEKDKGKEKEKEKVKEKDKDKKDKKASKTQPTIAAGVPFEEIFTLGGEIHTIFYFLYNDAMLKLTFFLFKTWLHYLYIPLF